MYIVLNTENTYLPLYLTDSMRLFTEQKVELSSQLHCIFCNQKQEKSASNVSLEQFLSLQNCSKQMPRVRLELTAFRL